MTYFMALLIALSAFLTGPTQAHSEAPTQTLTQTIEAPLTALSYESPKVTTSPAPEAPVQAPAEAPQVAPAEAPRCEEDMSCWDCTTMGNLICGVEAPQPTVAPEQPTAALEAPVLTPQGTNPECSEQSMQTAADGSCLTATVCAVAGHVLDDDDGNCGPLKEND